MECAVSRSREDDDDRAACGGGGGGGAIVDSVRLNCLQKSRCSSSLGAKDLEEKAIVEIT